MRVEAVGQRGREERRSFGEVIADPLWDSGQGRQERSPPVVVAGDQRGVVATGTEQQRQLEQQAIRLEEVRFGGASEAGEWAGQRYVDVGVVGDGNPAPRPDQQRDLRLRLVLPKEPQGWRQQQHVAEMIRLDHQDAPGLPRPGSDQQPRSCADRAQEEQTQRSAQWIAPIHAAQPHPEITPSATRTAPTRMTTSTSPSRASRMPRNRQRDSGSSRRVDVRYFGSFAMLRLMSATKLSQA